MKTPTGHRACQPSPSAPLNTENGSMNDAQQQLAPDAPLTRWEEALVKRLQRKIDKAIAERVGEPTAVILAHIRATCGGARGV